MKNTIKYPVEPVRLCRYLASASGWRVPLMGKASANKLAQLPALKGQIGKTAILELLRGQKKEAKGFSIIEAPAPVRANKMGVEYIGTGKLRQRQPMKIYIRPVQGRGMSERCSGDFAKFLTSVYHACHANKEGKVEYNELTSGSLQGWSRDMVSVYAARARTMGLVETIRESNKIGSKAK